MATSGETLREYLVRLGYAINVVQQKKFDTTLLKTDKLVKRLGLGLVGVATGAVAMVKTFTSEMEKLYYSSRRTGATVENLQAIEAGARRIGMSGEQMRGTIESFARALRTSPGLVGLLKQFGVKVQGRDISDVMKDTVRELRKMPFYVGSKFAAMFGMDPDTFLQMSQNLDQLDAAEERRKQMNRDAGLDVEAAAKASHQLQNDLRDVEDKIAVLGNALTIALLKPVDHFLKEMSYGLTGLAMMALDMKKEGPLKVLTDSYNNNINYTQKPRGPNESWLRHALGAGAYNFLTGGMFGDGGGSRKASGKVIDSSALGPGQNNSTVRSLMSEVEKKFGLPPGLLWSVYGAESSYGTNLTSKKGAHGPFQLMPKTAKAYGISWRENELIPSLYAAAQMLSDLLKQYGGNLPNALAGWNWGSGKFAAAGNNLGAVPRETADFTRRVMAGMQQNITFNISGDNANQIATAVGDKMNKVNGQLYRNTAGAVK